MTRLYHWILGWTAWVCRKIGFLPIGNVPLDVAVFVLAAMQALLFVCIGLVFFYLVWIGYEQPIQREPDWPEGGMTTEIAALFFGVGVAFLIPAWLLGDCLRRKHVIFAPMLEADRLTVFPSYSLAGKALEDVPLYASANFYSENLNPERYYRLPVELGHVRETGDPVAFTTLDERPRFFGITFAKENAAVFRNVPMPPAALTHISYGELYHGPRTEPAIEMRFSHPGAGWFGRSKRERVVLSFPEQGDRACVAAFLRDHGIRLPGG